MFTNPHLCLPDDCSDCVQHHPYKDSHHLQYHHTESTDLQILDPVTHLDYYLVKTEDPRKNMATLLQEVEGNEGKMTLKTSITNLYFENIIYGAH